MSFFYGIYLFLEWLVYLITGDDWFDDDDNPPMSPMYYEHQAYSPA